MTSNRGAATVFAAGLFVLWGVWVFRHLASAPRAAVFLVAFAAVVAAGLYVVRPLAMRPALLIYGVGLLWYTAQILLIQLLPQSRDVIPDSTTYRLNAEALVLHWRGEIVPARAFHVFPYPDPTLTEWRPGDPRGYAFVFGSYHFLYQLYAAVIYVLAGFQPQAVILSHAVLLAGMAVLTAGLVRLLFASGKVAALAAVLVLLDTNFAVNAAWMLKDTLAMGLAVLIALLSVRLLRERDLGLADTAVLTAAFTMLSCARFHAVAIAFLALAAGAVSAGVGARRVALRVGAVMAVTLALSGLAKIHSYEVSATEMLRAAVRANWNSIKGATDVVGASWSVAAASVTSTATVGPPPSATPKPPSSGDESVIGFSRALLMRPVGTVVKSVAHTLFAPYPWVAFTHGLRGNFVELHYPGTVLWILGLPLLAVGLASLGARRPERVYVLVLLASTTLVYMAVYGEFSTRQRQFMAPVCWGLAAFGAVAMVDRRRRVGRAESEAHFAFGKNWASYADGIGESQITEATANLRRLLGGGDLIGQRVIDIGCGSGLHSLAALRLGAAEVVSVDIDADSVSTTDALLRREAPGGRYRVVQASVFDLDPATWGTFDLVYAWGVLHHTGDLAGALRRAGALTAPGGLFIVALYRKTWLCGFWRREKRWYAHASARVQKLVRAGYRRLLALSLRVQGRRLDAYVATYAGRGMDFEHDLHDWLGGYPYESVSPREATAAVEALGLCLVRSFVSHGRLMHLYGRDVGLFGSGCDEYVCARPGRAAEGRG
jgi:2-polyprenyl-6-hydroxyphenyl methylase/3-demethylubiquinone-9 3-methyltransferase